MQGLAEPVRGTFPPFFLLFFPTNPRGAVILSERAARARAKDLLSRRLRKGARAKDLPSGRASGTGRKQVLRACGAQDDRPARFAKGERETTLPVPDPSDVAEPVTFAAVARSRTGDVPPTLGPNERFEHEARDQQDEAAGEGGNPMNQKAHRAILTPSLQA